MKSFTSQENKGLLWGLLSDQNIFDEIPNNEKDNIQKIFEEEIKKISEKANNNSDLLILNKLLIQNFTTELHFYKQQKGFKNQVFNSEYENKKKEFENYMKANKPDEVKFKLDLDEPLNSDDLDKQLNLIYKHRSELIQQYDTSIITPNKTSIINNNEINNNEINNNEINNNEINNNEINNNEINNKNEKKVEFNNTIFTMDTILEEKEINNNMITEINNKLDILSSKTDILINKINKLESKIL